MNKNQKVINPMNLVGHLANKKADKVINTMGYTGAVVSGVRLNKVVLREQAFDNPAGKPFYAFAKYAGEHTVLVDLVSGHTQMVNDAVISSMTQVTGKFKIDGVIYDKLDTVNGQARYHAVRVSRRTRAKALLKKRIMDLAHEFMYT